jgi:hypothetical protein
MTDQPKPPDPKAEREAKLAQALRANLRRRKAVPPPVAKDDKRS